MPSADHHSQTRPLRPTPTPEPPSDGRRARGERSREAIVAEATQLASIDGLDGLSTAVLADRLGVAKSSVHAAFGSKASLQVAVIRRTREILIDEVIAPVLVVPSGAERLTALGESWIAYLSGDVLDGGCLLCSASAEVDGHPGPPRDELASVMAEWLELLAQQVRDAVANGEFSADTDADQVAFELHAIGMTANWHHQLFGGPHAFRAARTAWTATLDRLRTRQRAQELQ